MKISNLKKANRASQKSSRKKKLENRKRVKYGKKREDVLERKAITYYDFKKQKEHMKLEKKKAHEEKGKNDKKRKEPDEDHTIPLKLDHLEQLDGILDADQLADLIRSEDQEYMEGIDARICDGEDEASSAGVKKARVEEQKLGGESKEQVLEGSVREEEAYLTHYEKSFKETVARKLEVQTAEAAEQSKKDQMRDSMLLPIKIFDKVIPKVKPEHDTLAEDSGIDRDLEHTNPPAAATGAPGSLPCVSVIQIMSQRKAKLFKKQLYIGNVAPAIIADPQEMGPLMGLVSLLYETDADVYLSVRKMAAVSLLRVFSSILPAYRLGTMDRPGQKLKKTTRDLAVQENRLLSRYKYYLKGLESMLERARFKKYPAMELKVAKVALTCFCELLSRKPVFNFADRIIELIVPYLAHRENELRAIAFDLIGKMFFDDEAGKFSIRILKEINKFVRREQFQVHTDIFRTLLKLQIVRTKPLDETIEKRLTSTRERIATQNNLIKMRSFNNIKMTIEQKKRKRKVAILEHKLKNKRVEEQKHKSDTTHTAILEMLFGLYVHVVKNDINRKLLGAVLEGLAKFGHLVNVEYFSTLLRNLERVLIHQRLTPTESVHCIQTVFKLLSGLGASMPNDPSNFSDKLFSVICKIKATDTSLPALPPALRTIIQVFIGSRGRVAGRQTVGYVKRLATVAMAMHHGYALPTMLTARSIMLNHRVTECLLDTSSEGGSGVYRSDLHHPVHCNANVATLWETVALGRSYHPMLRAMGTHLSKGAPLLGDGCLPASFTKLNVDEVHGLYSTASAPLPPLQWVGPQHWPARERTKVLHAMFNNAALQNLYDQEDDIIARLAKPDQQQGEDNNNIDGGGDSDDDGSDGDDGYSDHDEGLPDDDTAAISDDDDDTNDIAELTDNENDDSHGDVSDDDNSDNDDSDDDNSDNNAVSDAVGITDSELTSISFYPTHQEITSVDLADFADSEVEKCPMLDYSDYLLNIQRDQ